MALPDEYVELLDILGSVFESYEEATGASAVLVGGAATSIYTDGEFMSGDFDVVAGSNEDFERALTEHGFVPEDGPGMLRGGFYHPDFPAYAVEQVSGRLFDGNSRGEPVRITILSHQLVLPRIEDMIADRLAQHSVASPTDDSRLRQARRLFSLAETIDRPYLTLRVRQENGDLSLLGLEG